MKLQQVIATKTTTTTSTKKQQRKTTKTRTKWTPLKRHGDAQLCVAWQQADAIT